LLHVSYDAGFGISHDLRCRIVGARAPLRKTSVSGSEKVPDWDGWKTLVSIKPADSTRVAHCNDRDFGTSLWRISNRIYTDFGRARKEFPRSYFAA
jgi:hypothetical protein